MYCAYCCVDMFILHQIGPVTKEKNRASSSLTGLDIHRYICTGWFGATTSHQAVQLEWVVGCVAQAEQELVDGQVVVEPLDQHLQLVRLRLVGRPLLLGRRVIGQDTELFVGPA